MLYLVMLTLHMVGLGHGPVFGPNGYGSHSGVMSWINQIREVLFLNANTHGIA